MVALIRAVHDGRIDATSQRVVFLHTGGMPTPFSSRYADGSASLASRPDLGAHVTSTRTLSIVVTDVVGSTDLLARLGQAAYESIRRRHLDDLRRALSEHNGREIKTMGDGMLSVFESAV